MLRKISGNGGYSWWTRPIFIQAPTNLYFTAIANNKKWRAFQNSSSIYKDLDDCPELDDHNAPSILVRPSKDKFAFATRHGKSGVVNKFKANGGLSTFQDDGNLNHPGDVTYSQVLDYGNKICVFSRVNFNTWRFFRTTNWGSTWSSSRQLLDFGNYTGQMYMITAPTSTAGVYHLAIYGHPVGSNYRGMVYGRISMVTDNVANASGTIANLTGTNLPLTPNDFDDIAPTTGTERARLFDVGEAHGNPVILYAKWDDTNSIPAGYWMAYRDSSLNWNHVNLNILCGATFYQPSRYYAGMSIDKNGNNKLYVAREDNGTSYIESYPINSDMTIGTAILIDSSTTNRLVRPYAVEGGNEIAYQKLLHYNGYTNYGMEYWIS